MENDATLPVFTVGTLPKKCYTDPQELLRDFAAALSVPSDTSKVIKGAQGEPGPPGPRGTPGPQGPAGQGVTKNIQTFNIPSGVSAIDIPYFEGWQSASYNILYNGYAEDPVTPFDPTKAFGVGTLVPVYSAGGTTTTIRVYFIFRDGVTVTYDANFILEATSVN